MGKNKTKQEHCPNLTSNIESLSPSSLFLQDSGWEHTSAFIGKLQGPLRAGRGRRGVQEHLGSCWLAEVQPHKFV